eukprot:1000988-Prymnesium_polylepis.1
MGPTFEICVRTLVYGRWRLFVNGPSGIPLTGSALRQPVQGARSTLTLCHLVWAYRDRHS